MTRAAYRRGDRPGSDFASTCGAYDEAVERRPGKLITLRQKARVIKKKPMRRLELDVSPSADLLQQKRARRSERT
jgi:hypothetical protein